LLTLPTVGATDTAEWHSFHIKAEEPYRNVQLYGGDFAVSEMEVWGHPKG
jgi:hypothetical protein